MAALLLVASGQAYAATLNVCPSGCPYTQLAPALAAADNGDTIRIGPGTYDGGVTIDVSVKLVGAGAGSTIIRGGGPVLTIGTFGASSEPTVSIDGITITGGVTRSSPESTPFVGEEGVIALGGGVEIPANADFSGGAAVTIRNSAITGNRVAPTTTLPFGPPCPGGPCPFAWAKGGGIDSWGTLTLDHTTVSDNRVGTASGLSTLASDAEGAGIVSWLDALTIRSSVISDNVASATAPNGRFAEGGAIWVEGGPVVTVSDSLVTNNSAVLNAALPASVELVAQPGGVFISDDVARARITNTTISGNSATMTNSVGDATAFAGGINVGPDVDFQMANSIVAGNTVTSTTLRGSHGDAEGDTGGAAVLGTISNTRFTGNTVTVSSVAGDATAFAGAIIDFGSITNSVISDNHVHASSPRGTVFAAGAIVVDEPGLALRNSEVTGNTTDASGASGSAQGGGIFDAPIADGPPGGPLKLLNSGVTGNALSGSPSIAVQGGGLYIENKPLTLNNSFIANNSPDQCFGC